MNLTRSNVLRLLAGGASAATLTLPQAARAADPLEVAFIYPSPVGEAGWSYQHDLGRKAMQAALGSQVVTKYIDNVPEGPDSERVIRDLATKGYKVIFTPSFGYMNFTVKVAKDFPGTIFEQATGYKLAPNVAEYNARFYEGRYLCGVIAGKMTKSHTVGYVAAFPIPEVLQGINAFTIGLRSVDPKATVKVIWVNSWYDPGREREAAETLISEGADILLNHTDSTAVVQTAEEKGVWVLAYNSDMHKWGPKSQLTAVMLEWGDYYTKVVKDVLAGTWKSTSIWGGIGQGFIKLAPLSPAIPAPVKALVAERQAAIASGKLSPFTGPLSDNTGKQLAPAGTTISDADLQMMNYYVQGVEGKVPGGA